MKSAVCPLMVGGIPMLLLSVACGHPLSASDLLGRIEVRWDRTVGSPNGMHGQLRTLEELGYMSRAGSQSSSGRPSVLWVITPEGETTLNACWHELLAWKRARQMEMGSGDQG